MKLERKRSFYEKNIKRILDIICSFLTIVIFSWIYLFIAVVVRVKMGAPVLFKQVRPGLIKNGNEQLFYMYKFRTMTNERDADGNLLPDEARLPAFGRMLRTTSLDELPEVFNILRGDMSIIGPRPQLVRDMVFMDENIRMRHTAKPGLSGLAQVNGRNAITWEQKFEWDLKYIENVSFRNDVKILWMTVRKVFGKKESSEEIDVTDDYGDAMLKAQKVSREEYDAFQIIAMDMIKEHEEGRNI